MSILESMNKIKDLSEEILGQERKFKSVLTGKEKVRFEDSFWGKAVNNPEQFFKTHTRPKTPTPIKPILTAEERAIEEEKMRYDAVKDGFYDTWLDSEFHEGYSCGQRD